MRKFGLNRKNPNPPWPDEQPVVMVPPGVSSASLGMAESKVYNAPVHRNDSAMDEPMNARWEGTERESFSADNAADRQNKRGTNTNNNAESVSRQNEVRSQNNNVASANPNTDGNISQGLSEDIRMLPIMGNLQGFAAPHGMANVSSGMRLRNGGCMNTVHITGYLCEQTGKYVRIEFMFGEQTHVEKTGILREVGKDFVVIQETGTNNMIVCSTNRIKFINIYNMNANSAEYWGNNR